MKPLEAWGYPLSVALYAAALAWAMLSPPLVKEDDLFTRSDLVAHVLAIGLLAFLLALAVTRPKARVQGFWLFPATAGVAFVYSAALESLQLFIPTRTFSVADLFANLLGALAGYLSAMLLLRPVSSFDSLLRRG